MGDCEIEWVDGYLKVEDPVVKDSDRLEIDFAIPVKSAGKQQCILLDIFGRLQPEGDKFNFLSNQVYIFPGANARRDRYFEATLIKPNDTLIIKGQINFTNQDGAIVENLSKLKYMNLELHYKYYCRNLIKYARKTIKIDFSKLKGMDTGADHTLEYITTDEGQEVLPIRTPLLGPNNSLEEIFEKYARTHIKEGDIFAICESALAIMEGRVYYVEDIKPGFLALHINKLFKMDSSLSSPYSLQKAIEEVGALKIITSVIMGGLGRLIGRRGDFYAFAGRAVATIDDCTGTLPPFDKYVVMGPRHPQKTADEFKEKYGIDLAVVDVNDLGKVDVLGLSDSNLKQKVIEALKPNPQGNADQQTPVAVIRYKTQ
ncbi:MAG: coenzyme F420-0:L-glutamate ligase [Vulcanimicrobiota bacterium]